ncbi:cell division protein FtsA [Natronincola ferrireducens]|uniref:Cell division protein FtsA n=1 Tax=Natronincola ferrireducens TaxID=393762 RepID=A0A1G9DZV2_9FIRM|nr:cell division FtsA domain-containing protein [Natronincola ferrireducens]SDK69385.1 cell division protein FtsA [Natronincola ferrireducens]
MIFVLDIGTRSIVGLLGTLQGDTIVIHHAVTEFHKKRVIYDGQIHDIEGVIEIVEKVKTQLEEKIGFSLKEVALAAAGRALKTFETTIEKEIDEYKEIDRHLVNSVEIEGIQQAQKQLQIGDEETRNYFCVGHTPVNYYLNDGLITNPIGHRGKKLKIDILATFLPKIVVDSLYTVMEKVGLEVSYLTLEPIAAIEVAVPQNMRLLNIALVDIGAGTSDIAITKDGTVIAYEMTSTAGDEITEELARQLLLDFDSAEKLKCNLFKGGKQSFTDIIGISYEMDTEEILDKIQSSIELVGKEIADGIVMQNGKSPSVIFLIGGGSQIPSLTTFIADYLTLPKERVVVRDIKTISNLQWETEVIQGPEGITPIGIMVKAIKNKSTDFIEVKINNKKVNLFKTENLKVSDALISIGFNPRDLIPKKGGGLEITLNGQDKYIYGEYGEPAKIFVNDKEGHLDTPIDNNDKITIELATVGKDAACQLQDVINFQETFLVNGEKINKFYDIKINGMEGRPQDFLKEKDKITYKTIDTVRDLCVFLNLSFQDHIIYIDGDKVSIDNKIPKKSEIIVDKRKDNPCKEQEEKTDKTGIDIIYNGEPLTLPTTKDNLIFVDVFNYVDFDRTAVKGKLVLKHNNRVANYTDPLQEGDDIWVYWE